MTLDVSVSCFFCRARKYYWQSNLAVLLMLVLIVIPWLQVYTFLRKTRGWRWRTSVYTTTAAWACYLYLFSATFSSQYWEQVSLDWLEFGIIRVGILGITLTSMLSGFGMVDTPFSTWKALTLRVKDADYRAAQLAYQRTLSTINKKKSILAQAQPEQAQVCPCCS
ncbi:hypothetical protein DM01DRAFT_53971 [Hesseltinella vesiculosa]|uniref:Golgi pH regulator conserved domain-containing protein n=1 Tax=Hesseltinella vesiculosa TaxID=101127 RepID=A0A1X2GV22_9FUNG|nr:hypothetical protein DM01DRAFT_53971 [Hesseltinella vesiculosa]